MMTVTTTWQNAGPNTIWSKLAQRLGREPTNAEATAEVKRILADGMMELAAAGKMPHQRGRKT
jgi:hypothetical protein